MMVVRGQRADKVGLSEEESSECLGRLVEQMSRGRVKTDHKGPGRPCTSLSAGTGAVDEKRNYFGPWDFALTTTLKNKMLCLECKLRAQWEAQWMGW